MTSSWMVANATPYEPTTVVVNADGTVKNICRLVKPAEHAAQVLGALGSS